MSHENSASVKWNSNNVALFFGTAKIRGVIMHSPELHRNRACSTHAVTITSLSLSFVGFSTDSLPAIWPFSTFFWVYPSTPLTHPFSDSQNKGTDGERCILCKYRQYCDFVLIRVSSLQQHTSHRAVVLVLASLASLKPEGARSPGFVTVYRSRIILYL